MVLDEFPLKEYNDRRGSIGGKEWLREIMISPTRANAYPKRFSTWDIISLVGEGISPEDADLFSDRFSAWAIIGLVHGNCSPKEAERYDARFGENDIRDVAESGCYPDDANKYNIRFQGCEDISQMFKAKVSPQRADEYNKRFTGKDIAKLALAGCSPERADDYPIRFKGKEIAKMFHAGCDPHTAKLYLLRFDGGIAEMVNVHCSPDDAERYDARFNGSDVAILFKEGVTPDRARLYDPRFGGGAIVELVKNGVSPREAESYIGYDAWTIVALVKAGISPEEAKGYGLESTQPEMRFLAAIGSDPADHVIRQHGKLISSFVVLGRGFENRRTYPFGIEDTERLHIVGLEESYQILGAGRQSIVLLNKDEERAYKLSHDLQLEVKLFKKLRTDHGRTSHVIQLVEELERGYVDIIELEYIRGKTILEILRGESSFSLEKALNYSAGIFRGLLELKVSGIFHRDLWLSNIMVEENTDRVVIIDLGLATDQPNAPKVGNRRYGGENDLQSLGQIVYKMATGDNLFNDTDESTGVIPSEVRDRREEVYHDPNLLEEKLQEVDANIQRPRIREIIKTCLTARSRQDNTNFAPDEVYERLQQLFHIS